MFLNGFILRAEKEQTLEVLELREDFFHPSSNLFFPLAYAADTSILVCLKEELCPPWDKPDYLVC